MEHTLTHDVYMLYSWCYQKIQPLKQKMNLNSNKITATTKPPCPTIEK